MDYYENLGELGDVRLKLMAELVGFASFKSSSRAAMALGISPSTLSKHISQLESALGFPVVNKGFTLTLTPAGKKLVEVFARTLEQLQEGVEASRAISRSGSDEIVLETNSLYNSGRGIVATAMKAFATDHPGATFRSVPVEVRNWKHALRRRDVDLCYWYEFGDISDAVARRAAEGVGLVRLSSEDMVVWAKADHPIFTNSSICASDIAPYRVMSMLSTQSMPRYTITDDLFKTPAYESIAKKSDYRAVSQITEFLMLDSHDSIYILPESYMQDPIVKGLTGMRAARIADGSSYHHLFLAYALDNEKPSLRSFVRFLNEGFAPDVS